MDDDEIQKRVDDFLEKRGGYVAAASEAELFWLIKEAVREARIVEHDRETWQRTDALIDRLTLYGRKPLRARERRDLVLLLRRYRKLYLGSALTDEERASGFVEINP